MRMKQTENEKVYLVCTPSLPENPTWIFVSAPSHDDAKVHVAKTRGLSIERLVSIELKIEQIER